MENYYEGQKKVGETWIVVIGKRKDKELVKSLIQKDRGYDSTLGGLISAPSNKNAKYRIVTWVRVASEEI